MISDLIWVFKKYMSLLELDKKKVISNEMLFCIHDFLYFSYESFIVKCHSTNISEQANCANGGGEFYSSADTQKRSMIGSRNTQREMYYTVKYAIH